MHGTATPDLRARGGRPDRSVPRSELGLPSPSRDQERLVRSLSPNRPRPLPGGGAAPSLQAAHGHSEGGGRSHLILAPARSQLRGVALGPCCRRSHLPPVRDGTKVRASHPSRRGLPHQFPARRPEPVPCRQSCSVTRPSFRSRAPGPDPTAPARSVLSCPRGAGNSPAGTRGPLLYRREEALGGPPTRSEPAPAECPCPTARSLQ